jgi:hypothetical protein
MRRFFGTPSSAEFPEIPRKGNGQRSDEIIHCVFKGMNHAKNIFEIVQRHWRIFIMPILSFSRIIVWAGSTKAAAAARPAGQAFPLFLMYIPC